MNKRTFMRSLAFGAVALPFLVQSAVLADPDDHNRNHHDPHHDHDDKHRHHRDDKHRHDDKHHHDHDQQHH